MKTFSSALEDLLSTLPREEGISSAYSYKYQGFWYGPLLVQGLINCQRHFEACENDIFLVTSPKSGTTWLKAILYALINRQVFHPQDPDHPLLTKTPHQLVPFLELLEPSDYDSVSNSPDNRIFGSHIPTVSLPVSMTLKGKIVYLCRDIKDTLYRTIFFSNRDNCHPSPISLENALEVFCKGVSTSGPVWDHILGYWKESRQKPDKVLFMRYEDMTNEPRVQLRRLTHFLGKPFSQEEDNSGLLDQIIELCSFDRMSKLEVNKTGNLMDGLSNASFFRSGLTGDWKDYLSTEMALKLDRITEENFHGSGLTLT